MRLTGLLLLPLVANASPVEAVHILAENCYACHSQNAVAGLRLDSRQALLKVVTPGDPAGSRLLRAVSYVDDKLKMPPGRKLSESQIATLKEWIQQGAPWPESSPAAAAKKPLWSLAPLQAPAGRSIDALVKADSPKADRRTLLRRVSFDLTGLPPTFEDMQRGETYEESVDRLLASPHFGERWARRWLDVARYAEDDVRGIGQASYPNAWRYRDWVVRAFNEDLPYDQFIRLQIAADLLPRQGRDDRAALGLFGLGPWYYSNAPPPEARADERHDRVDVLTRGFLGLTVACARCHDHKFDPITTRDYYALAQVFARTQYTEFPLAPSAEVESWDREKQRIDAIEKEIKDYLLQQGKQLSLILARDTARYVKAAQGQSGSGLDPETIERWKTYLARSTHEHPFLKQNLTPEQFETLVLEIVAEKKEIDEENEATLAPTRPKKNASRTRLPNGFSTYDEFCPGCDVAVRSLDRDRFMLWSDLFRTAEKKGGGLFYYGSEEIERFLSGPWKQHLESLRQELERRKRALAPQYPYLHGIADRDPVPVLRVHLRGNPYSLGDPAPEQFLDARLGGGSGRKPLAEWISRHPLAARVAVNRIWGDLFGDYIVGSPSNFGSIGERPSNPQLLEELAARFSAGGYSVKKLIRSIVLSEAYQRRRNRRRLDAEGVRDAALAAAGLLDPTVGGASVDLATDRARRSLYGKVSRFRLEESLSLFDFPSPSITSEKRNVTHVPLQQLFFLNSGFIADAAAALAKRLESLPLEERIQAAYRRVFTRDPAPAELEAGRDFLQHADFADYAQVLLSSNEFYFVD